MTAFSRAIENIRGRFYTFEEFPLVERSRFPIDVLKNINDLEYGAAVDIFRGRELEALVLEIADSDDMQELTKGVAILCERMTPRLLRLLNALYQYRYDAAGLKLLLGKLWDGGKAGLMEDGSFLSVFGKSQNIIAELADTIAKEGNNIDNTFLKYGIIKGSPLALETYFEYFSRCEKIGCMINHEALTSIILESETERLKSIINNYMDSFAMVEYIDNVSLAILNRLGDPYISTEWAVYSNETRDKFARWSYLWRMKEHCKDQPEKFNILMGYIEFIKTNYYLTETDVLITDLGWMLLADVRNGDTFLYEKRAFEKEMENWRLEPENLPTFMKPYADILTGRKFMLSVDDAPCIRLGYEGINKYYVEEVLNIKTGVEPDMRKLRFRR